MIDAAGELAVSTIAVSEQLPFEVINVHPTYSVAKEKESCTDLHMQSLLAEVAKLADLIPNIENISCGRNLTDRANGFTHGIIVTLTCQDALACYINHPAHVSVGKKLNENANILAMDYET